MGDELLEELRAIRTLLEQLTRAGARDFLTKRDAAKRLGVSRSDLDAWIAEGRVKAVDVDGRTRVSRSELDRLQRDGVPKTAEPREPTPIKTAKGWRP